MIPSCLYFLFKKRMELEILKEHFSPTQVQPSEISQKTVVQKLSALKKRSKNVLDSCAAKCN
jgi:hypothetical protein